MKILLIHNFYRYRGGEDRYVKILEDILIQNNHQVIHFFFDSRSIQKYKSFQKCLIPFRLIHSQRENNKLKQIILKNKPDIAVVHNLFPLLSLSILKILKKNNIPIIKRLENYKFLCLNGLFLRPDFSVCESCKQGNFFHGIIHRCYQMKFSSSLGIAIAEFIHHRLKTVKKNVDIYLATSNFVKRKFVEAGFPENKITVQPNFIDFSPLEQIENKGKYALYLGRLSKEKGLLTLLKAFKNLEMIPLKILGEGPMQKELVEFVRLHQLKNIRFEGFIDGELKQEILKKAYFLVFPSECYESFGYTIIESYACGVPVIGTNIGGSRELIKNGQTGFVFKAGDPKDLENKIKQLMADPIGLNVMKRNALDEAKKFYTKEIGYNSILQLFSKVIENKSK